MRSTGDETRGPRRRRLPTLLGLLAVASVVVTQLIGGASSSQAEEPGPEQDPFLCTTEFHGLGQPIVDNHEGRGTPVFPLSAQGQPDRSQPPLGWSERCQAPDRTTYHYRTSAGQLRELPSGAADLPPDVAWLPAEQLVGAEQMDLDGADAIPYVLRLQRGTLPDERYMYGIAMLVPWAEVVGETDASHAHWNKRLVFSFGGGVGIGHSQGSFSTSAATLDEAMALGHAVLFSSGTVTSIHYNLLRGGRTAEEAKERFVSEHGDPLYTVGIGGSGGGIQQYVYGQNNPGVLDAAIPLYSYPDMTTQTIHTGDCELLEHYMDVTDAANPRWQDWDQRRVVQGLNTISGFTSSWQQRTGAGGSTECVEGWRGLTPLAMNPRFGFATGLDNVLPHYLLELLGKLSLGEPPIPDDFPDIGRYLRVDPDPTRWVEWTHWADVREAYGTDFATGLARVPWDNVGVQYGLRAMTAGEITPDEFLDLNSRVGSWVEPEDARPESCGLVDVMLGGELAGFASLIGLCEGAELDQHSARQMHLSDDPSVPAPRRSGDVEAIHGAFESGLVFDGHLAREIPIIDARHYLEHQLDMHNVHQSFAARERLVRARGHHDNHLIWFLDARPAIDPAATVELLQGGFRVMDEWMANLAADPGAGVAAARPAAAVDTCWDTDGQVIAAGADAWSGAVELVTSGAGDWTGEPPTEVDGVPVGPCAAHFPLHSTSRIVAGAPITGDVYKCHTMPVRTAVAEGLYGGWEPGPGDVARLEQIHPMGVCDHHLPSVGRPDSDVPPAPDLVARGKGLHVSGASSRAELQVRQGGEVVATVVANPAGRAVLPRVGPGDYVVAEVVGGQRGLLSSPATVG